MSIKRIGSILFLTAVLLLLANAQRGLQRQLGAPGPTLARLPGATATPAATAAVPPPATAQPVAENNHLSAADVQAISRAQIVPLATASDAPPLPPLPATLNDLPLSNFVVLPAPVAAHVRDIFARGQVAGRDQHAFAKIGDSSIADGFFLTRFDGPDYNLGPYAILEATLAYFAGSFGRDSVTVRQGMHSWSVLDPFWADRARCEAGETPLACEIRLLNPALAIIRLGTNDVNTPDYYEENMRLIVESLLALDIVPILGTKADQIDGPGGPNNGIVRRLAEEYQLPLWDFELVAATLPGRGLAPDGVHLTTFYPHDYDQPEAMQRGHALQNLSALLLLESVRRLVVPIGATVSVVEDG